MKIKTSRLSNREKFIASSTNPFYRGFAKREEVKSAKLKARGKYWYDKDFEEFVSFSLTGRRQYFVSHIWHDGSSRKKMQSFQKEWKRICKKAAVLWCKGQYSESAYLYNLMLDHQDNLKETMMIK
jgi:hypothetical protein